MKTIEIGGKERHFKFGTNQTREYCKVAGINLQDYYPAMQKLAKSGKYKSKKEEEEFKSVHDIDYYILFYSAFYAGARSNGEKVDFDDFIVCDWIDDNGGIEFQADLMKAMLDEMIDSSQSGEEEEKPLEKGADAKK